MGEHKRSENSKEEKSQIHKQNKWHKFKFIEVGILATETWATPGQMMKALHSKLNKDFTCKACEAPRCYQAILEEANTIRAAINR